MKPGRRSLARFLGWRRRKIRRGVAPTIEFNAALGCWRVTYAGACREHQQAWQAWVFYEMARARYDSALTERHTPA
jgi:hypothetical protein